MPQPRIAVTGATGFLGGRIARILDDRNIPTRLIVRNLAKAPQLKHADVAVSTYVDHAALVAATTDIDTVFWVSGFEASDRLDQHRAAIDAFVEAGVQRVVYTSFINCAPDSIFTLAHDHYHTEQIMEKKGLPFVALRNNFYSEMVPRLVTDGVIRGPAGNGRFAPVARTDVADVAVAMLTDPTSPTGRFDVTGPELLSMEQAAALLTEVSGNPVVYQNETLEEAYASRAHIDAPQFEIEGWVTSYSGIAAGEFEVVSDTVERFAGHLPMTLRAFLEGHS
ncbi:Quinone oxidoreductase 2 [Novipirellula galeiformis]|uniref:Quinone oxidoreductase 2 n=1 Tax=Novipirellula galeiformis TaxID=2528004 RepID=A0A5C6CGG5_9BACT|nr:SDR family oxidoreductase [Novipirellula galeiformis]TWU23408.1 Quinone oxidoreductase 2 [Novipirellula galeiformis]